jgi:hypothetical protein
MLYSTSNKLHTNVTKRDDGDSFLDMVWLIIDLTDMTKLAQTYPNNQTQERNQLLRSIKYNMTDRHIVNTCLKHV